jgi:hypothetical protein
VEERYFAGAQGKDTVFPSGPVGAWASLGQDAAKPGETR